MLNQKSRLLALMSVLLAGPIFVPPVSADDWAPENMITFGASTEDPGNAYALSGRQSTPPYDNVNFFLVPDAPYARGGHHLGSGKTWIEVLGRYLKVSRSTGPAWRNRGQFYNYAVAQARARDDGINRNFKEQRDEFFLLDNAEQLLTESLIVVALGGNDVRDALTDDDGKSVMDLALDAIEDGIKELYDAGGREFLVVNAPDIGLIPSVTKLDELLGAEGFIKAQATLAAQYYNANLNVRVGSLRLQLPKVKIEVYDSFKLLGDIATDPAAFGLVNASDACIMPGKPPYQCKKPGSYFYWDGIHPTQQGYIVWAKEVYEYLQDAF